jgi:hypothetical protein
VFFISTYLTTYSDLIEYIALIDESIRMDVEVWNNILIYAEIQYEYLPNKKSETLSQLSRYTDEKKISFLIRVLTYNYYVFVSVTYV